MVYISHDDVAGTTLTGIPVAFNKFCVTELAGYFKLSVMIWRQWAMQICEGALYT